MKKNCLNNIFYQWNSLWGKNELSKKVFKHIGFKNVESNLYKIDIEKLISYTKPF